MRSKWLYSEILAIILFCTATKCSLQRIQDENIKCELSDTFYPFLWNDHAPRGTNLVDSLTYIAYCLIPQFA